METLNVTVELQVTSLDEGCPLQRKSRYCRPWFDTKPDSNIEKQITFFLHNSISLLLNNFYDTEHFFSQLFGNQQPTTQMSWKEFLLKAVKITVANGSW